MKNLVAVITGFLALDGAASELIEIDENLNENFMNGVKTASLNSHMPVFLAGHRSHSSHQSHSSHRSSSGGGYSSPTPKKTPPARSDPLGQQERSSSTIPDVEDKQEKLTKSLQDKKMKMNLIMRIQLVLSTLGFYTGDIDGLMGPATRASLNAFRRSRGIKISETLDVYTLNALGVSVY